MIKEQKVYLCLYVNYDDFDFDDYVYLKKQDAEKRCEKLNSSNWEVIELILK